jgi:hypothetical protein
MIQWCDIVPNIHPPLADHMLIISVIDLPLPCVASPKSLDFRAVDWPSVNEILKDKQLAESPALRIQTKDEFIAKVDTVIKIIKEVLKGELKLKRPSRYACRWWMEELSKL